MDPIETLLTRGVDRIYPSREALEKVLRSGKKLRLYQGFDPTGTKLHIGHAVAIRKLREFQDLGHHVIFLIGDGTGQAGDPSGKNKSREKFMTRDELRANAVDYVKQASKIVRLDGNNPVEILYNSDWLNKLTLVNILDIAGHFSWQQLAQRDLYQERIKKGENLNFREALYPLLQGYDSVAMNVDLELGGTDQTFNMLAGRQLVAQMQGREKFVMTVPLLADAKGTKIGKTEGNAIGLTDEPNDFYGKIMSLGDDAIIPCFTLLTDMPLSEIAEMKKHIESGENPMTYKKQLAFELTKQFNSEKEAEEASLFFEIAHQRKLTAQVDAEGIRTINVANKQWGRIDFLVEHGLTSSRSEAKRLLEQKAIELNDSVVPYSKEPLFGLEDGAILRVGKKTIVKIHIT
ncbi:tyrosine--tRNA ligase [Patescibacteria group bacterium]|nr:tyrosine--tRNA ligase [Patescibacteria group bacterium]